MEMAMSAKSKKAKNLVAIAIAEQTPLRSWLIYGEEQRNEETSVMKGKREAWWGERVGGVGYK